jgi:hypothetical protein
MDYPKLIKHFGTEAEAVRALGIPQTTINAWADSGIPSWRQYQIEVLTNGKLRASKRIVKRNGG